MSCYLMSSHNCKRFAAGLVFYNCTATEADCAKHPSEKTDDKGNN